MSKNRLIPFEISRLDSLGQGVSKLGERVTFIPKTLPGETGSALILAEKKGVAFGRVEALQTESSERTKAACEHFESCPSCHFLHVSYETELKYKLEAFRNLFRKVAMPEPQVIGARERLGYRNRIQLHYSLKTKLIGLLDAKRSEIIPVPGCLIGRPEIASEIRALYRENAWLKEAPANPGEGHVELYWRENKIAKSWNRPYAEGGFTQVNEEMNKRLKLILNDDWKVSGTRILDLFAGDGNMSADLNYSQRLCVDIYGAFTKGDFFSKNLYAPDAISAVKNELLKRRWSPEVLLLDPPRSGLANLKNWIEAFTPGKVAYVSCDPHTLARDLQTLTGYRLTSAWLIDFFPSTFHFESLVLLERNN